MRVALAVGLAVILAACSGPAPSTPAATEAAERALTVADAQSAENGCRAYAYTQWDAGGGATFGIEAWAVGETCAEARVLLNIMDATSDAYSATLNVSDIEPLSGATSVDDLQNRFVQWLVPAGASMDSTGDLAAWEEGAPEPSFAEVAFHPAPRVTREIYEALRAADAPMYCYEQNRESGVCLTVWDGVLEPIGVQMYAG